MKHFVAVRRKPPGLNRTFYSSQPDGSRRAATNAVYFGNHWRTLK
ncbi:hypothetical protein RMSM_07543 [Rhodopirellula maiorica SM1]|uniref:Uncharacterized protein n=1 Tax=Rhodopirellula maiorica SM1 TaxID=1265738 RepID=M5R810_9BACT|nr:hypothetical protein RMSM_07543 [Rhodopirellula maiorica SM1]